MRCGPAASPHLLLGACCLFTTESLVFLAASSCSAGDFFNKQ